jgi:hypothetical protein
MTDDDKEKMHNISIVTLSKFDETNLAELLLEFLEDSLKAKVPLFIVKGEVYEDGIYSKTILTKEEA